MDGAGKPIPPVLVIFGILPPTTPVSDTVTFTIPNDVNPVSRRLSGQHEFGGEALNRGATLEIKVGTNSPAPFVAATGRSARATRMRRRFRACCMESAMTGPASAATAAFRSSPTIRWTYASTRSTIVPNASIRTFKTADSATSLRRPVLLADCCRRAGVREMVGAAGDTLKLAQRVSRSPRGGQARTTSGNNELAARLQTDRASSPDRATEGCTYWRTIGA